MAGQRTTIEFNEAEWAAGLKDALESWRPKAESDLVAVALRIQNAARSLCPVDTGRLRSSIQSGGLQRDGSGPYVEVGTNVAYAPYVEFGTVHQKAQPYLRPAFLQAVNEMVARQ